MNQTTTFINLLITTLLVLASVGAETYFYAGGSAAIASKDNEQINYHYYDRLGTNFNNKNLPFGQSINTEGRFGYTGKEADKNGLIYYGARYYDASIGRFTNIDPIEDNYPYQYVHNNPLNYIDPTGMAALETGQTVSDGIVAGTPTEGGMEYHNLRQMYAGQIPNAINNEGLSGISDLHILQFHPMWETYLGNDLDQEVSFPGSDVSVMDGEPYPVAEQSYEAMYIVSGKLLGEKLAPLLAPDAHITIAGNPGEKIVSELAAALPGRTITVIDGSFQYLTVGENSATYTRFADAEGLYTPYTAVTSIAQWDSILASGGMVKVGKAKYVGNPDMYYTSDYVAYPNKYYGSDSRRYHDFMNSDYRQNYIDAGVVQGIRPTTDTSDLRAFKMSRPSYQTIQKHRE